MYADRQSNTLNKNRVVNKKTEYNLSECYIIDCAKNCKCTQLPGMGSTASSIYLTLRLNSNTDYNGEMRLI